MQPICALEAAFQQCRNHGHSKFEQVLTADKVPQKVASVLMELV